MSLAFLITKEVALESRGVVPCPYFEENSTKRFKMTEKCSYGRPKMMEKCSFCLLISWEKCIFARSKTKEKCDYGITEKNRRRYKSLFVK